MSILQPHYQRGDVRLYLGDCREILPTLGKVDAVVTDPPYGTEELGGGYGRRQLWSENGRDGRKIAGDKNLDVFNAAWPSMVDLIDNGFILAFYAPRKTPEFLNTTGAHWIGEIVWDGLCPGLGYTIRYQHESIGVFRIGEPERPQTAMISVHREFGGGSDLHPHEKPPGLMQKLCAWACPLDGTALDPFMGSGTTGVACVRLGRKFIGIEIEPKYFDIACKRIDKAYDDFGLIEATPPAVRQAALFEEEKP